MVLDLIVKNSDDGCTAEIPSIKECESWAHNEDDAINKVLDLFRFYIHASRDFKIKVDRARKERNTTVYIIIFDK